MKRNTEPVAADVDLLMHAAGGVRQDERLDAVLRGLNDDERRVVFAYAESAGITWAEAAAASGATDPTAFGERVRRKVKRLADEQARRSRIRQAMDSSPESLPNLLPVRPSSGTE
ncbi:hypothetical protein ABZ589_23940 [Streptomyces sp. NPDC013313]|uniref:hypothetical protein n=1 Tax=Streptomyces sp. NPDC013313 TaxID=3155603 RepID=UPI00340CB958